MYKKIIISTSEVEYLRSKDDKMSMLIDTVGDINREYIPDPFIALVNSIVYQQIAYKAALSIWNRFEELITEINPDTVIQASFESLRKCGLSKTKINYIRNIAEATKRDELSFNDFVKMSDEEIIEKLTNVKGIGVWTAEMFLIFSLYKKDIISYRDLGIRRGLQWLYDMEEEPTMKQFDGFKDKFSPYNTIASFYLWEITIRNYFKYKNIDRVRIDGNPF